MQTPTFPHTLKLGNERLTDLVAELEDAFQPVPIHPKMSVAEIMYRAGQASVVDYFKSKLDD